MTFNQINERLAREVMGLKLILPHKQYCTDTDSGIVRKYFYHEWNPYTNISQAFMCVDKMRERGYVLTYDNTSTHTACFETPDENHIGATADTPSQAICLAIIKVLDQ